MLQKWNVTNVNEQKKVKMAYLMSLNIQANRPSINFWACILESALKSVLMLKKWDVANVNLIKVKIA